MFMKAFWPVVGAVTLAGCSPRKAPETIPPVLRVASADPAGAPVPAATPRDGKTKIHVAGILDPDPDLLAAEHTLRIARAGRTRFVKSESEDRGLYEEAWDFLEGIILKFKMEHPN